MDVPGALRAVLTRLTLAEQMAFLVFVVGAVSCVGVVWLAHRPDHRSSAQVDPLVLTGDADEVRQHPDGTGVPSDAGPGTGPGGGRAGGVDVDEQVVIVDVAGDVHRPGLVQLAPGSRVADAVLAAGGVQAGATTAGLNLARLLVDGEQIVVGGEPGVGAVSAQPSGPPLLPDGTLDLNRATQAHLEELPGVGPVTAQKIIAHREEIGRFTDVVELLEVPGIGPSRYADLEVLVGV